jgi:hypothetical protein
MQRGKRRRQHGSWEAGLSMQADQTPHKQSMVLHVVEDAARQQITFRRRLSESDGRQTAQALWRVEEGMS